MNGWSKEKSNSRKPSDQYGIIAGLPITLVNWLTTSKGDAPAKTYKSITPPIVVKDKESWYRYTSIPLLE